MTAVHPRIHTERVFGSLIRRCTESYDFSPVCALPAIFNSFCHCRRTKVMTAFQSLSLASHVMLSKVMSMLAQFGFAFGCVCPLVCFSTPAHPSVCGVQFVGHQRVRGRPAGTAAKKKKRASALLHLFFPEAALSHWALAGVFVARCRSQAGMRLSSFSWGVV